MKAYQEKYIENLKRVVSLSAFSAEIPGDIPHFIRTRRENNAQIRSLIAENTGLLRRNLMPLLDDIVSASEDDVADLDDFAAHLMQGAQQLDLLLSYTVRNALVTYARTHGLRDMLIRQLYHTGMALFYMQQIISFADKNNYRWKMSMMFGEAAAYIKQYDEIEDPEIRGYIHRSMANLALAYSWSDPSEAAQKSRAIRRSFQVLTDPAYHQKTPSLPWDAYIYKSHQERTTAMQLLRMGEADPLIVREVMESAEFIWKRQMENSRKRGIRPEPRWVLEYDLALYHCGFLTLPQLLLNMEKIFMDQDHSDFSESGIWGNVMLPAFYSEYMHFDPSLIQKKKAIVLYMYGRMVSYVQRMSNIQLNSLLAQNLLVCFQTFIEYPDGMQARDFLINLVVCRDPDIYVYLRLTADIAKMIMAEALERGPEQLTGVLSCRSTDEVLSRKAEILQFTFECGMLHDIGVFLFENLITFAARSRLKEEKIMYNYHVNVGKRILSRCRSTEKYAPAALGHHRCYDGSGGYPEEYRREEDPNAQVTDAVSIAAFMVGQMLPKFNDNRAELPVAEAVRQVRLQAGTRFSPALAGFLPALGERLESYMQTSVLTAYQEAFRLLKTDAPG